MVAELVPPSVNSDGNLRLTFTASGEDPLSAADLAAGEDLTYSLKTWNVTESQATIEDNRLTLEQGLSRPGRKTFAIEISYVFGDVNDVASAVLTEGVEGFITARYSVPNETAWTAAQVVDVYEIQAGSQRKDPPADNGVQTQSQTLYVTGVVQKDAVLAA